MTAIRGRMADLHAPLRQQASNQAQCQRPGLGSVRRADIEPHRVNDLPETNMIRMTLLGQTLQNIVQGHRCHLSVDELDLLDRHRLRSHDRQASLH